MGGKKRFKIRTWHFIILLVPLLFWAAFLLRSDHIKMTELRDAVLAADAEENDEKIASSLKTLQEYTFKNIIINIVDDNGIKKVTFGTGVFYLEYHITQKISTLNLLNFFQSFFLIVRKGHEQKSINKRNLTLRQIISSISFAS